MKKIETFFLQCIRCNWLDQKTKKIAISGNKAALRLLAVFILLVSIVGCAKPSLPQEGGYEAEQIQCGNLESTYRICKRCIEYTKINKFNN